MPMTNYLSSSVLNLNFTLRSSYLALHSSNPTAAGLSSTEIAGGSYVRKSVAWSTPASRAILNSAAIVFNNLPAVTVTYFAIWDSVTGGNCFYSLALPSSLVIAAGNTLTIPINDLAIVLS